MKNIEVKSKYVAPSIGYYEISKKGHPNYRLFEKMTSVMTQDKLAEFYEKEKQKGNPLPVNSIRMFQIMEDAMKSGNMDLMNYLQKGLQRCPNTLTRVIYNPEKKDETIHNYGTSDSYFVLGDVVGKDGWIRDVDNFNALESLLNTKDTKRLNEVSNAINKTPMYFWRVNSKPLKKVERVVGFYAGGGRLNLDALRDPSDEYLAFLVSVAD